MHTTENTNAVVKVGRRYGSLALATTSIVTTVTRVNQLLFRI
jgi:hypothetical protein